MVLVWRKNSFDNRACFKGQKEANIIQQCTCANTWEREHEYSLSRRTKKQKNWPSNQNTRRNLLNDALQSLKRSWTTIFSISHWQKLYVVYDLIDKTYLRLLVGFLKYQYIQRCFVFDTNKLRYILTLR